MGIQGLLPFLKGIHERASVSEYSGQAVAIDVYGWLHKGGYGCALQLAQGTKTDVYVKYCMKRVNMLRFHNITPILVFDGCHLPSKETKEAERRARRNEYRERGRRFLSEGERSRAVDAFQKCVDVTPEMALNVIQACRDIGVQCIVAPYEADAQLAYMLSSGLVQLVISEDSDLLVFGTDRVLFKMDANGDGVRIKLDRLSEVKALSGFTRENFRHACILSGCDYLASIPGLGLSTACKLLKRNGKDPLKVIKMLRLEGSKAVPSKYEDDFMKADYTFLYQLVFDPVTEVLTPLNAVPDDLQDKDMSYAGHHLSPRKAKGIAYGNINPLNYSVMDSYDPKAARCEGGRVSTSTNNQNPSDTSVNCRIQAKLRVNSFSAPLSKDSGFESQTSVDDEDDVMLSQYGDFSLRPDSTNEATNPDSSSQRETVMSEQCSVKEPFSSPFSRQKPMCKRTLFQQELQLAASEQREIASRHFDGQLPGLSDDQRQKRRRSSEEESLFASLDSSLYASESHNQDSSITELEYDRHSSIELSTNQESHMPDTTCRGPWNETEQQEMALVSRDVTSEVQEINPLKGATHSVYTSAFKQHLSDSSQFSQYWSQTTQKPRIRTGLSRPKPTLHRRSKSTVSCIDNRQSTLFQHFVPLHKSSQ